MPFSRKADRVQVNVALRSGQQRRAALLRRLGAALRDGDDALEARLRAVLDDVDSADAGAYASRLEALERGYADVSDRLARIEESAREPVAAQDLDAERGFDEFPHDGSSSIGASVRGDFEASASPPLSPAPSMRSTKVHGGGGDVAWFVGTGPGRRITDAGRRAIVAAWRACEAKGLRPSVVGVAQSIGTTADTVRSVLRSAGIRLRRG